MIQWNGSARNSKNRKDYWMQMEKDKMKMILQGREDS